MISSHSASASGLFFISWRTIGSSLAVISAASCSSTSTIGSKSFGPTIRRSSRHSGVIAAIRRTSGEEWFFIRAPRRGLYHKIAEPVLVFGARLDAALAELSEPADEAVKKVPTTDEHQTIGNYEMAATLGH